MALDGRAEAAPDKGHLSRTHLPRRPDVAIDGVEMSPATVLATLNRIGGDNGIGRLDLVENRYVGMKSRAAAETPAAPSLKAHRAIESLCLDRRSRT